MTIRRPMCLISVIFVTCIYLVIEISGGVDEKEYIKDGTTVCVIGTITDKVYKNNRYTVYLKGACINGENQDNKVSLIAYLKDDFYSYHIGQRVEVRGEYRNFTLPENEGQFNLRRYYRIRGYDGSITKAWIDKASKGYDYFRDFLYERKEDTRTLFYGNMPEVEAGTFTAMILGDKSGLDDDVKELYQSAGISHVLSLSGLHIAATGLFIFSMLFKLTGCNGISSVLAMLIMFSYGVMTGMSTSTVRALIMFSLGIFANCIDRTYDLMSAVSLSAILIIFENPLYVYDSGFQMSFSAVAGMGTIYPILNSLFDFRKEVSTWIDKIRQGMLASISATLATLPIVMNTFYRLSRMSILVNIILVPLMGVLLFLGIVSGFVGNCMINICRGTGLKTTVITKLPLFAACKILDIYTAVCDTVSRNSFNTWVTGKAGPGQIVVYIIVIGAALYISYVSIRKRNGIKNCDRRHIVKMRVAICLAMLLAIIAAAFRKQSEFEINVLSVGQGACNIVHGRGIPVSVIDAGSLDVKEVYKYRIEPFLLSKGIDRIDYLYITHPDGDHISGVMELLSDEHSPIRVNRIVLSVDDTELCKLIEESGVSCIFMGKGDRIAGKKIVYECISPAGDMTATNTDVNDLSLVLKITHVTSGFKALFTGDISSEVERRIISSDETGNLGSGCGIRNVAFMTAPHHGSRFSSSEEFLKYVNPAIITISSGEGNSYGHPHKETLERIKDYASNSRLYRTDECGQVTVKVSNGNILVEKFRNKN